MVTNHTTRRPGSRKRSTRLIPIRLLRRYAELLNAFGWCCAYCRITPAATWDHLIPQSRGGTSHLENLVPACFRCNQEKGDQEIEAWLLSRGIDPIPALRKAMKRAQKAMHAISRCRENV